VHRSVASTPITWDEVRPGRDDLAYSTVEVVDRHGQVVPDAVADVMFQVGGADQLAAVGNGNPHNVDSFRQPRRTRGTGGHSRSCARPSNRESSR
jgi:beta-galactosidase